MVDIDKTLFVYDESGLLLSDGEREFVYLGNIPVAMTTTEHKNEVLQIHTDHLETPRVVTNAKKQIVWRWEGDAFGDVQPQVEHVKMPLRFAGQYADKEVGLFYNYFRFYNPETGRYIENDPIDLQGGLNRYGYVSANPLHNIDPKGLVEWSGSYKELGGDIVFIGSKTMYFDLTSQCINNYKAKVKIVTTGIGASGGLTVGRVSVGGGKVTLNDNLSHVNPAIFNGIFYYGGMSYLLHGSIATVRVGGAKGSMTTRLTDNLENGWHNDILSFESVAGLSQVIDKKLEECCEN